MYKNIKLKLSEAQGLRRWIRSSERLTRCPFWGFNDRSCKTCLVCRDLFPEMAHTLPDEKNRGDGFPCPCDWIDCDLVAARVVELLKAKGVYHDLD